MDDVALARAFHVLFVVLWIGGVGFVTTALLPSIRRIRADDRMAIFNIVRRNFQWQARITTTLVGVSGIYMASRLHLWDRFQHAAYWWMDAMVLVWLIFMVLLFIAEPLVLHRLMHARAQSDPDAAFKRIERMHRILLILALITVFGAVAGSHGFLLFE